MTKVVYIPANGKAGAVSEEPQKGYFPVDESFEVPVRAEAHEKKYLDNLMGYVMGNITQAAKISGLSRATLYRKLGDYLQINNRKAK